MGNPTAVPDLVTEHESSEAGAQGVPGLVAEYEASQSRKNAVPDLVSQHEASQKPPSSRQSSFVHYSRQLHTAPAVKSEKQPYSEEPGGSAQYPRSASQERPLVPVARAAAAPGSIPKPQGIPPAKPAGIPAQPDVNEERPYDALTGYPTPVVKRALDPERRQRVAQGLEWYTPDDEKIIAAYQKAGADDRFHRLAQWFQTHVNEPLDALTKTGVKVAGAAAEQEVASPQFGPFAILASGRKQQQQELARLRTEHPALAGASRATGEVIGGMVADPRMWPFFFAGPEVAGWRAVSPALRAAYGAGFATQMGIGAVRQAGELGAIMDQTDIPPDQKWELGANAFLSALMAGFGGSHQIRESFVHDFSRLPATDQAQIRQRIRAKAPDLAAQVDQLASPPDAATQALLDHQQANGDLSSPQAATQAMLEYEKSSQPSAPSTQPLKNTLSGAEVEGLASKIASRPEAERGALIDELHRNLAQWIIASNGKVVVHGRVELANTKTPEQAEVLAQRIINDAIHNYDRKSSQQPALATQRGQVSDHGLEPGRQEPNSRAGGQTSPASAAPIAPMGRGMTTDSPAVRRVEEAAQVVPGQEPLVMVKKESPQDAQALAQPAQPVSAQDVAKIGREDPESGRKIVQPSESELENERLAAEAAPELATQLSRIAATVPGATFHKPLGRLRPQKNLERVEEKVVGDDKPPRTIQDYLAGQIAADTPQAKDLLIAELKKRFKVIGVEDKFLEGRPELAGYPSANVQVQMANGSTAEVQIVPREVQQVTDLSHRYYTDGRKAELEGNLAARDWNHARAAEINGRALEAFKRRTIGMSN